MSTLKLDNIDGRPSGEKDEKGWLRLERSARITGVAGSGPELLPNSLKVIGLPKIGSQHPAVKDMIVTGYRPEIVPADKNTVDVAIIYERRDETDNADYAEIEVGTSLRQGETNKDANGALITATYTDPNGVVTKYCPTFPVDDPLSTLNIRLHSNKSPGELSRCYVGKCNSGSWRADPAAAAARTWKCISITGRSTDGCKTWDCLCSFEYDEHTWDQEDFYHDADGKVPRFGEAGTGPGSVIIGGNGYAKREAPTADFNALGLA